MSKSKREPFSMTLPFPGIHALCRPRGRRGYVVPESGVTVVHAYASWQVVRDSDLEVVTELILEAAAGGNVDAIAIMRYLGSAEWKTRLHERLVLLGQASTGLAIDEHGDPLPFAVSK